MSCNAAKTLAAATNKPLVGVHHMVSASSIFNLVISYLTDVFSKRMP